MSKKPCSVAATKSALLALPGSYSQVVASITSEACNALTQRADILEQSYTGRVGSAELQILVSSPVHIMLLLLWEEGVSWAARGEEASYDTEEGAALNESDIVSNVPETRVR